MSISAVVSWPMVTMIAFSLLQTTFQTKLVELGQEQFVDLDSGSVGQSPEADLKYEERGRGLYYLAAQNGAGMAFIDEKRNFFALCADRAPRLPEKAVRLTKDLDGKYACLRTSDGRIGVLRINENPIESKSMESLTFGYTVWTAKVGDVVDEEAFAPDSDGTFDIVPGAPRVSEFLEGYDADDEPVFRDGGPQTSDIETTEDNTVGATLLTRTRTVGYRCPTLEEIRNDAAYNILANDDGQTIVLTYLGPGFQSKNFIQFEKAKIHSVEDVTVLECEYILNDYVKGKSNANAKKRQAWNYQNRVARINVLAESNGVCRPSVEERFDASGACFGASDPSADDFVDRRYDRRICGPNSQFPEVGDNPVRLVPATSSGCFIHHTGPELCEMSCEEEYEFATGLERLNAIPTD